MPSKQELSLVNQEIAHLLPDLANGDHTVARLLKHAQDLVRHPEPYSPEEQSFLGFDGDTAFKIRLFGNDFYNLWVNAGQAGGIMYDRSWVGDWSVGWHGGSALYPKGGVETGFGFTTHWPDVKDNEFSFTVDGTENLTVGSKPKKHLEVNRNFILQPDIPLNDRQLGLIPTSFAGTWLKGFEYQSQTGLYVVQLGVKNGGELNLSFPAEISKVNLP